MNAWSIAFAPPLPTPVMIALGVAALAMVALTAWRRPGAAILRALVCALLLAALADPSLVREDRRPLKDVVALVIDQSEVESDRRARAPDGRGARRTAKAARARSTMSRSRVVETARGDPENRGTQLFAALHSALADTPPERVGGAIVVTDGIAHDIPASAQALGFNAPLHVLITGHEGERDRRIELVEAPRFGIVGKDQTIVARVLDTNDAGEPAIVTVGATARRSPPCRRRSARRCRSRRRSNTPAPMSSSSKLRR